MSENFIRHMIAFFGTFVGASAWLSGYVSGIRGWWWTVFGVIVIYIALYNMIENA